MNKYSYRLAIAVLVYFFFRISQEEYITEAFDVWNLQALLYFGYTLLCLLTVWEAMNRSIDYWIKKDTIVSNRGLYKVSLKATFLVLPLVFFFAFIFSYFMDTECCEGINRDPATKFWVVSAQGFVISLLIISHEIISHYIRNAIQTGREKEMMQKELIAAKFEGLKNQVNPHFLFNSFSVLSSLVEKDSNTAIRFISRLSDMYRYILENDERMMVTVREELSFLDDYLFLLEMRHLEGLVIEKKLTLKNLDIKVPPLSLQILVENAVKHNAFSIDDPLTITITNEGDRFIVVENQKRPKNDLVHSTGIGLKNLSKRLTLSLKRGLEIVEDANNFRVKLPIGFEA